MADDSEKMAMREVLNAYRRTLEEIADYDYERDPLVVRDKARDVLRRSRFAPEFDPTKEPGLLPLVRAKR